MPAKPKIIFVGDYNREDYVRLLNASKDYCNLYFLFYASPNEEVSTFYKAYGKSIYWKDFESAQQLLKSINPSKIVFLYIESYNHVVLNLAAKQAAIPTYLLEHGLRADYVSGFDPTISPSKKTTLLQNLLKLYVLTRDFWARYKSRRFLNKSISLLPTADKSFAKHFIEVRKDHNYLETFRKIPPHNRTPNYYIGFSHKIYETYKAHEAAYFGARAKLIGIPYFDAMAQLPASDICKSILLIDQPLAEQGLLQWNWKYKYNFAEQLTKLAQQNGYQLYIKPHPRQHLKVWTHLEKQHKCTIIDDKQLLQLASSIPIVIGFYSTYLMPFAAFSHTTVITYENHPAGKLNVSKSFIEAGVAHPIYHLQELESILQNIDELHQRQLPHKAKFTEEWMYKFDGKSGERLRDILLEEV